jgi:hypothetical protein
MSGNAFAVVYVDRKTPITGFLNKNLDGLKQENDSNETERNIRTIMAAFGQGTSHPLLLPFFSLIASHSSYLCRWRLLPDDNCTAR